MGSLVEVLYADCCVPIFVHCFKGEKLPVTLFASSGLFLTALFYMKFLFYATSCDYFGVRDRN